MSNIINHFLKDESGATMVEYAVLVALIAVAVIAVVYLLGEKINQKFNTVLVCLQSPDSTNCKP